MWSRRSDQIWWTSVALARFRSNRPKFGPSSATALGQLGRVWLDAGQVRPEKDQMLARLWPLSWMLSLTCLWPHLADIGRIWHDFGQLGFDCDQSWVILRPTLGNFGQTRHNSEQLWRGLRRIWATRAEVGFGQILPGVGPIWATSAQIGATWASFGRSLPVLGQNYPLPENGLTFSEGRRRRPWVRRSRPWPRRSRPSAEPHIASAKPPMGLAEPLTALRGRPRRRQSRPWGRPSRHMASGEPPVACRERPQGPRCQRSQTLPGN